MSLKEQLHADLTDAMRSRDELRLAALRMALTAVTNEEVAGKQARVLSDEDVLRVLGREIKKRKEAAQAFADAGRPDRAEREQAEARVLEHYLPAQLTDDELTSLVRAAVTASGATDVKQMGQVMKVVQPQVTGQADGSRVAAEVRRQLAGG
jgi:uncharacterized protein YqeY